MGSGQTLAEKIISSHAGKKVIPGEIVVVDIDGTISHDAGAPYSIKAFSEMGGKSLWDSQRTTIVMDHASPSPNEHISRFHQVVRDFVFRTGCRFFDIGEGICHQLMVEYNLVKSGDLFLGGDSHTSTYGALGAFAIGVGSTDIAGAWLTGRTWIKVPRSRQIILEGQPGPGVFPKDIILALIGKIGLAGAVYEVLEFSGEILDAMPIDGRMTLANMAVETGAKTALMTSGGGKNQITGTELKPDPDARYSGVHRINLTGMLPQVSLPNAPDQVVPIDQVQDQNIHMAFIGTCANGRLNDLRTAADILKGKTIAKGVQLIIAPASRAVLIKAVADGTAEIFLRAGGIILPPGCGPCAGTHQGIPGDGQTVISSANRNFPGRMGNRQADIYLASPAMVAASALTGQITDPTPFLDSKVRG